MAAAKEDRDGCQTSTSARGADQKRRGILAAIFGSLMGLGFAALGLTTTLWTFATGRFMLPNTLVEPPNRFRAGFPRDYPPGQVETRFKESHGVWIVHGVYQGKPQIYALRTVCTHLGCITIWQANEQRFKCPCHGSGFSMEGVNLEGPAPRPLERYAIRLADDGQLEVDTSVMFQQELGQWNDPASYVAV
ncbi:MAG: ubiquinol-cytochrome c reductase iron-sulfur subunit [Thermoguttaceae bacterium]